MLLRPGSLSTLIVPPHEFDQPRASVSDRSTASWPLFTTTTLWPRLQMPEMDGWEATELIRQRERGTGASVAIIALTARAMSHTQERSLACGMDAVIAKPFDSAQLYETVEQEFGAGGVSAAATVIAVDASSYGSNGNSTAQAAISASPAPSKHSSQMPG